jgi:hypothetical protein
VTSFQTARLRVSLPGKYRIDYLDGAPPQAAWTAGKAGLAGASAVAGWLQKRQGRHGERADHEPGS